MNKPLAFSLIAFALMAAPAVAAPICSGSFGLDREIFSEEELNEYNYNILRSNGVNVIRAEVWGGCIRAFVRLEDGSEQMQFFDPQGFRRVE
ncbi:hypothetical protein SAMN05428969_1263 [Devosia sp. YR412]|uniref:hypothetical protein n=1 Tax=Devosia sp. YR412 TaxID=1881030 RepID=UPI0008CC039D|nr:hypothetical protein [Devosia sp. YR412]SEP86630.1 hypothetical protein SAMN05428969_1263 [Devosia sp. YR412]